MPVAPKINPANQFSDLYVAPNKSGQIEFRYPKKGGPGVRPESRSAGAPSFWRGLGAKFGRKPTNNQIKSTFSM